MDREEITVKLNLELESIGLNQLTELGNQAIAQGLIAGHGHHQGQYEILCGGEVLTMAADEAVAYLQQLVESDDDKPQD